MLSIEQALELVEQHARPLAPQRVELASTVGLLLAKDVISRVDSPPYNKALMDGYAVVSSDRMAERTVIEEIGAGTVPRRPVTPGTATRLMTGAPLPDGADAIVPIEKSKLIDEDTVRLLDLEPTRGQHILPLGAALREGDVLLRAGAQLRPVDIGILAEIGHSVVTVQPRPRVAVLSTGNELVPVGEKPGAGQIRNSNGPMLLAALAERGADPLELPIARDEPGQLRQLIAEGLRADILLLSGGVSAGKFDLVPDILGQLDVRQVFHKVALRPGKPLWFGAKSHGDSQVLVFGLPGNPVSTCVCFELFVRPTIAALAGRGFAKPKTVAAQLAHDFSYKGGRASYLPAQIACDPTDALPMVEMLAWHGSADLATLARANALVRLGTEPEQFKAGATVDVLQL